MAISEAFSGSATIGSNEYSLTEGGGSPTPAAQTDDGVYQLWLGLGNLAAGDVFELSGYEKVRSADSQAGAWSARFAGVQSKPAWPSPSFILMHGWDFTLKKISGTDRAISWSIRKVA